MFDWFLNRPLYDIFNINHKNKWVINYVKVNLRWLSASRNKEVRWLRHTLDFSFTSSILCSCLLVDSICWNHEFNLSQKHFLRFNLPLIFFWIKYFVTFPQIIWKTWGFASSLEKFLDAWQKDIPGSWLAIYQNNTQLIQEKRKIQKYWIFIWALRFCKTEFWILSSTCDYFILKQAICLKGTRKSWLSQNSRWLK